jgi:hypothetical protein
MPTQKIEKRDEARKKKEIPFIFIYKKHNLDASTIDYSSNGLSIKIYKKVSLPVGDIVSLHTNDSVVKAKVMWVKKEIDPHATVAGLKIVEGKLNLKGARKNMSLTMISPPLFLKGEGEITKYKK